MKKKCICCGIEKDISEYYSHPRTTDGHLNKCKECCKKQNKDNREKHLEYYREYDRNRKAKANDTSGGMNMFEKEAEEYANENWEYYEEGQNDSKALKQAYLAGLKAGRPQWHDLRKDPNDLPKANDEKLCFYEKGKVVARYDSGYSCWETYLNNFETVIPSSVIIAWCELPQFTDKE